MSPVSRNKWIVLRALSGRAGSKAGVSPESVTYRGVLVKILLYDLKVFWRFIPRGGDGVTPESMFMVASILQNSGASLGVAQDCSGAFKANR